MNAFRLFVALSIAALTTACSNPAATSAAPAAPGMPHDTAKHHRMMADRMPPAPTNK